MAPTPFSISCSSNLDENPTIHIKNPTIKANTSNKRDNKKTVIVTRHLAEPCPSYYTDIFETIVIICTDPEHETRPKEKELN